MVKDNISNVIITTRNIKYYNDRNYNCKVGDTISIDISTMPKMSHNKVIAICEICLREGEMLYSKYNENKNRQGFYSCKGCSGKKRKKTNLTEYGVEYISQLDSMREIRKEWMSSDEFKKTSTNTQMGKYGCLYVQTDIFKESNSIKLKKVIKAKKESGDYYCPLSSKENNDLKKEGMFKKYGEISPFLVPEIKSKIQNINLERYGHISPFGNKEIQKKIKGNIIYKITGKEYSINGNTYSVDEFKIYRRKVRYETNLVKKELFEYWDGYDFYDGEYIKDNLNLSNNSNLFPSIDHKISCLSGFLNGMETNKISDISNLCITKRILNIRKKYIDQSEFESNYS